MFKGDYTKFLKKIEIPFAEKYMFDDRIISHRWGFKWDRKEIC